MTGTPRKAAPRKYVGRPTSTPAADIVLPDKVVVDIDIRKWSLMESLEVRRELGIPAEGWQDALKETPEYAMIGSAWLLLRPLNPGLTWQQAASVVTMRHVTDTRAAAAEDADPKV